MKTLILVTAVAAVAAACVAPHQTEVTSAPAVTSGSADVEHRLDQLAEAYFEEMLALYPVRATIVGDERYNHLYTAPFSAEVREQTAELSERYLRQLQAIDRAALDQERRLTYDVFQHNLESEFADQRFPSHLQPLNQFFNFTAPFVEMGSGTGIHPFRTVKDYDDFLSRIDGFEQAVETAIANMREGLAAGVVQPRLLMERVLPQLSAHLVDDVESSLFWGPIQKLPESFPAAERERLSAAYTRAIREQLVPTFRRLHDFVRDEYLPHTRETHGFWALPDGRAWYEHMFRVNTTTSLTADEVHEIGLAEVARIHQEMDRIKEQVGFQGTLVEFLRHMQTEPRHFYETREEMLADYRAAQAAINASTDRLFDVRPRANYEIRPVEPFYERSFSGGSYTAASPDGSRPGVFRLNTYEPTSRPRYARTALLLHEGSPGHHFQRTIQRELEHLPRLRRFGGNTAYVEGWGLYAETLGEELGVYTDPYQHYGVLDGELWRAIRLVLDTGIHAKGWTREQAIEYALRNSSVAETYAASEVERFMAIPGQALAYKIGQMKIQELRERAERELGPGFDVRAFHRAVLEDGALPLGVLEAKIERWIAERRLAAHADPPLVPYLGHAPPGLTPVRFAPDIVSTAAVELNSVFSPDGREFFFTRLIEGDGEWGYPGRLRPVMHHVVFENGAWSAPRPLLLFPGRALSEAVDMSISPDGQELFFMGQHPHEYSPENPPYDLWVSRRKDGAWATATPLPPPVHTAANEIYSSVVADGSLYFTSDRPGGLAADGRLDLYRAQRLPDGGFAEPVNVGPPVNSVWGTGDTFVAPDESYLIFASSRPGGFGQGDLYVSFRQADGGWGEPINLGPEINSEDIDYCPMVSPDGRFLFFSRRRGPWEAVTGGDVFWVDAEVIHRLRPSEDDGNAFAITDARVFDGERRVDRTLPSPEIEP